MVLPGVGGKKTRLIEHLSATEQTPAYLFESSTIPKDTRWRPHGNGEMWMNPMHRERLSVDGQLESL
jgi:hypothetical protein